MKIQEKRQGKRIGDKRVATTTKRSEPRPGPRGRPPSRPGAPRKSGPLGMKAPALLLCVAAAMLAGCDSVTDILRGGAAPYPIRAVWVTQDTAGRTVFGGRVDSQAHLVDAAVERWAKILAPTPIERGTHVLEKQWMRLWKAGDRIPHGVTILVQSHPCGGHPGCASGALRAHPDNASVMVGWVGLHSGGWWDEAVVAHEIGHELVGPIATELDSIGNRRIVEPRVVAAWREWGFERGPFLELDSRNFGGIHPAKCTVHLGDDRYGVMTQFHTGSRYWVSNLTGAMLDPRFTYDPDEVTPVKPTCG